ncbi:MAG: threonine/serine exporter family protein, partial [Myxococcota bacterium]
AVAVGGLAGDALVASLAAVAARAVDHTRAGRVGALAGSAAATAIAVAGSRLAGLDTAWPALLGGIVYFLPGYSLTVAATELAAGQLVSGTARLASAGASFVQVALGMAMTASALGAWGELAPATRASGSVLLTAAAIEGVCFMVLLQAARRDLLRVVVGSVAATALALLPAGWATPLVAAAVVSATSEVSARRTGRPAVLLLVPGILALVPGTLGLGGISALLREDVAAGVAAALGTAFTAVALAAGVLLGQLTTRR